MDRGVLIDRSQLITVGMFVVPFILTAVVSSYLTYRVLKAGIEIGRAVRDDRSLSNQADGLDAAIDSDND